MVEVDRPGGSSSWERWGLQPAQAGPLGPGHPGVCRRISRGTPTKVKGFLSFNQNLYKNAYA